MSEKFYRPGLTFKSRASACQFIIRPKVVNYGPDGLTPVSEMRELLAEFAVHRPEYTYIDSDGMTQVASDISGHFFDLDAQAEQKGWTDEEKEVAANRLLTYGPQSGGEFWLHTKAPAAKPWPKYDDAHWDQIPVLAEQLGLVAEALEYEKENKARKSVVAKLSELLTAPPAEDSGVEELAAA